MVVIVNKALTMFDADGTTSHVLCCQLDDAADGILTVRLQVPGLPVPNQKHHV